MNPNNNPIKELQHHIDKYLSNREQLIVLEAGCGSGSNINIPNNAYIVGIDVSQEELDKNKIVTEKILGDLQTYELERHKYDFIICWDVLEHLDNPELAMEKLQNAVRPDGLILLAFPNVRALKSIVAKFTPYWFHRFIYRCIYGARYGSPGLITFPTYLRWSIEPKRVLKFAYDHDLVETYSAVYESGVQKRFRAKLHLPQFVWKVLDWFTWLFSFGQITLFGSDCIYLFLRPKHQTSE